MKNNLLKTTILSVLAVIFPAKSAKKVYYADTFGDVVKTQTYKPLIQQNDGTFVHNNYKVLSTTYNYTKRPYPIDSIFK